MTSKVSSRFFVLQIDFHPDLLYTEIKKNYGKELIL